MADTAKVEHKVMGLNDNKTSEQSNGLKVEVAIFIFLILAILVSVGFWVRVGWPSELSENICNLLTVEAVNDYIEYKEKIRATQLQYLTTIAASLGAIGVVFNLYYTGKREEAFNKSAIAANKSAEAALENAKAALKNAEAAQDKQITERFTKAVEQLASEEIAIRLGGIYALERIAKDSEKDHWTIMEILTAFVRENRSLKETEEGEQEQLLKIPTDIQAVLTVIGRRNCENEEDNQRLDLHKTNLQRSSLSKANLQAALLYEANLQGAVFHQANLQAAVFNQANLQAAFLWKANLQKASLLVAELQWANFEEAELQGALLNRAKLQEAKFFGTNLEGADFSEANLNGADLSGAKNLKQEQINKAFGDKNTTRLPEDLQVPEHWTESE